MPITEVRQQLVSSHAANTQSAMLSHATASTGVGSTGSTMVPANPAAVHTESESECWIIDQIRNLFRRALEWISRWFSSEGGAITSPNSQPNGSVPSANIPQNFVQQSRPVNRQPSGFVPPANIPQNFVQQPRPVNSQPNDFVPSVNIPQNPVQQPEPQIILEPRILQGNGEDLRFRLETLQFAFRVIQNAPEAFHVEGSEARQGMRQRLVKIFEGYDRIVQGRIEMAMEQLAREANPQFEPIPNWAKRVIRGQDRIEGEAAPVASITEQMNILDHNSVFVRAVEDLAGRLDHQARQDQGQIAEERQQLRRDLFLLLNDNMFDVDMFVHTPNSLTAFRDVLHLTDLKLWIAGESEIQQARLHLGISFGALRDAHRDVLEQVHNRMVQMAAAEYPEAAQIERWAERVISNTVQFEGWENVPVPSIAAHTDILAEGSIFRRAIDQVVSEAPGLEAAGAGLNPVAPGSRDAQFLQFYRGLGVDDQQRTWAQIRNWNDVQLENSHNYIQWLFPLRERSQFNPQAPLLNEAIVQAFRNEPTLRDHLLASFQRMLSFYGLRLDQSTMQISRAPNAAERQRVWMTPGNHNYLRITRILTSMRTLGFERPAQAFYQILNDIAQHEGQGIIAQRSQDFWRNAAGV